MERLLSEGAYKRGGLISEGAYKRNRKSTSKQAITLLLKIRFVVYCFLIKFQNTIINRIHFNARMNFLFTGKWPITGVEGGGGGV